nr:TonB-dependent receptor [Bacteroidota bacterium]
MKTIGIVSIILCFIFITQNSYSQADNLEELLNLGIEGLLDAEVVSASKTRQHIADVPANIQIVTSKEIRERGYQTLEDLLSDLPGFQFRNIQGFNSYVFQRGIPNQNNLTLVLIDGIQVNELNSGGFYGGAQYLLSNIEQVEIIYGPASAVYGTNAISGVINLITKKPENSQGFDVNAGYGSFNTYRLASGYGYYDAKKDLGIRIAGKYYTTEKTPLEGEKGDFNWTDDMENFERDVAVDLSVKYKNVSYGVNIQNKQASRSTNYKSTGTAYIDHGTLWNISFINSYLKYSYTSPKYALTPVIYYRNATVLDNTIGFIDDTTRAGYYRPNSLVGIDVINQYKPSDPLTFVGGIVFEYEMIAETFSTSYSNSSTEKPPAPEKPTMLNNNLFSAYLQANYKFIKSFNLIAGVRFDNSSYYDQVVTPRVALVFNRGRYSGKLLYNEAYRAPRPWDYTNGIGNPDLKPETIKSLELINTVKISEYLFASVSYYRNVLDNVFIVHTSEGGWWWVNSGKVKTDGVEAEAKYRKSALSAWINYTYNYSINNDNLMIPEISKHCANAGFYYYLENSLNFGIRANYIGQRKNTKVIQTTNTDHIDPATVINVTLGFSPLKNLEIMLYINNVLNTTYYHTSNRSPDRYRQAQRYFGIDLHYTFF